MTRTPLLMKSNVMEGHGGRELLQRERIQSTDGCLVTSKGVVAVVSREPVRGFVFHGFLDMVL